MKHIYNTLILNSEKMVTMFWVTYIWHLGNGLLETFLAHHKNIHMTTLINYLMGLKGMFSKSVGTFVVSWGEIPERGSRRICRVVRSAQRITGCKLPALQDMMSQEGQKDHQGQQPPKPLPVHPAMINKTESVRVHQSWDRETEKHQSRSSDC